MIIKKFIFKVPKKLSIIELSEQLPFLDILCIILYFFNVFLLKSYKGKDLIINDNHVVKKN